MNNRIKEIIASEHLSDGEFADLVGIKRSTLSHCLSGRNDVSKDIITKIHNAYPYISINWLMFGEGESGLSLKNTATSNLFDSLHNSDTEYISDSEYSKDFELKISQSAPKIPNNQQTNIQNSPSLEILQIEQKTLKEKKIEKIMVFYTDSTFEVFER
ncbi:MAG: helix-turn-helix transcriptional regulator [Bacteroidales bacterium]|nr:helix-turn-helix transcriptional regulator [Bacteroidales bacterium]MBR5532823.1 helix-turn-helix transcriptional regulator [Bacteroidales bacterium]